MRELAPCRSNWTLSIGTVALLRACIPRSSGRYERSSPSCLSRIQAQDQSRTKRVNFVQSGILRPYKRGAGEAAIHADCLNPSYGRERTRSVDIGIVKGVPSE